MVGASELGAAGGAGGVVRWPTVEGGLAGWSAVRVELSAGPGPRGYLYWITVRATSPVFMASNASFTSLRSIVREMSSFNFSSPDR